MNTHRKTLRPALIVVCCALLLPSLATRAAAKGETGGPLQAVRQTNERITKLLRQQAKTKSAAKREALDAALKKEMRAFLDFDELARQSLGRHWAKRSAAERAEFSELLRSLIESSYLKQTRANLKYELVYNGQELTADKALVRTVVRVKRNGRLEAIEIDYKMHKGERGWMVYDVLTDDVSIVRNYRSQFNRIIRRQSYQALLDKMRDKLKAI